MVDRSFVVENLAQLRRLQELVETMTDDDLAAPMEAGWTVASVLAHVAFWDYRTLAQLERWGPDGTGEQPRFDQAAEEDWINDANKRIFLAIPPRVAAGIAIEAAEAADQAVAAMSDELHAKNEELGRPLNPFRAEHRGEHLDEIESGRATSG